MYILIVPFPVWAGIRINSSLTGNGIKIIPAKTGNRNEINSSPNRKWNYEKYTSCKINLSVDSGPPKRKDMQLQIVLPLWKSAIN